MHRHRSVEDYFCDGSEDALEQLALYQMRSKPERSLALPSADRRGVKEGQREAQTRVGRDKGSIIFHCHHTLVYFFGQNQAELSANGPVMAASWECR